MNQKEKTEAANWCLNINQLLSDMGIKPTFEIYQDPEMDDEEYWYMGFVDDNGGTYSTGAGSSAGEVHDTLSAIDFVLTWVKRKKV